MRKSSAGRVSRPAPAEDPRSVARSLVAALGEQAPCHATYQAFKARQRGDRPAMDVWLWIAGTAREMLRSDPLGEQ